jgi:hypothetical protein
MKELLENLLIKTMKEIKKIERSEQYLRKKETQGE